MERRVRKEGGGQGREMEGKKGRGGRVKGRREDAGRKGVVVVWEEKRHEVLANHIIQQSQTTALLHVQCMPSGHVSGCR